MREYASVLHDRSSSSFKANATDTCHRNRQCQCQCHRRQSLSLTIVVVRRRRGVLYHEAGGVVAVGDDTVTAAEHGRDVHVPDPVVGNSVGRSLGCWEEGHRQSQDGRNSDSFEERCHRGEAEYSVVRQLS